MEYRAAARTVREYEAELKDRSYRQFPIGSEVRRFLRSKRLGGKRPKTLASYETVLRLFTLRYPDFDSLEPFADPQEGPELVLDFLERWADSAPATLEQRFAVMDSFFEWAYKAARISADPMGRVEKPARKGQRRARRQRVPQAHVARLVSAQSEAPQALRDQSGLLLLAKLALRREDLRLLQLADVDLGRDEVYLRHGKGGKEAVLPLAFPDVRETLYLHLQERGGRPDEFLIYPKTDRLRAMSETGIDGWFRRCVARAGLAGYTMHQLRHSAIDELRRQTHDTELARQLARHENIQTTSDYLHSTLDELREAIETIQLEET